MTDYAQTATIRKDVVTKTRAHTVDIQSVTGYWLWFHIPLNTK